MSRTTFLLLGGSKSKGLVESKREILDFVSIGQLQNIIEKIFDCVLGIEKFLECGIVFGVEIGFSLKLLSHKQPSIRFNVCKSTTKIFVKDKTSKFCKQSLSNNVILQTVVDTYAEAA